MEVVAVVPQVDEEEENHSVQFANILPGESAIVVPAVTSPMIL